MQRAVSKVQAQLAKLEREDQLPTTNLVAAEANALKGDSLFERNLAAASLQLELQQHQLVQKAGIHAAGAKALKLSAAAKVKLSAAAKARKLSGNLLSLTTKLTKPFYWVHTPAADEKAAPAQLKQQSTHARHLLTAQCSYQAFILVPTAYAFDARVKVMKHVNLGLVNRGLMPSLVVTTDIENLGPIYNNPVRLAGCDDEKCCRLEIKHEGEWGSICDDVSSDDRPVVAALACDMAGCPGPAEFKSNFGGGQGNIWLDDVRCSDLNTELGECENSGDWGDGNDDCGHDEDMGVCCADGCTERV